MSMLNHSSVIKLDNLNLEDMEVIEVLNDRERKKDQVEKNERVKLLKYLRIFVFISTIFVLHFVTFTNASDVDAFGTTLSSVELVGASLGIAIAVWIAMLFPVFLKRKAHMPRSDLPWLKGRGRPSTWGSLPGKSGSTTSSERPQGGAGALSALPVAPGGRNADELRRAPVPQDARRVALKLMVRVKQVVFKLYDSQEYWVARLARLAFYCLAYIASTYWLVERFPNGQWDFSHVPPAYIVINYVSLWTTFFDYTLEVLSGGWSYVLTVGSLVELCTQPPVILLVTLVIRALEGTPRAAVFGEADEGASTDSALQAQTVAEMLQTSRLNPDPSVYLLQFGWLRFLSAYRVNRVTLGKLDVRSIRVRIASLALAVTCIFLIIAGGMFTIEARLAGDDTFVNYYDFFYFAVVTGSTVGYGDFSPTTPVSRLLTLVAIVLTLVWIPDELSQLQAEFSARRTAFGVRPRPQEPFVLLTGHVTRWQLRIFLRNFERISREAEWMPARRIVVLSPDGVDTLDLQALGRSSLRRLFVMEGDLLTTLELGTNDTPIRVQQATHIFVYCGGGSMTGSAADGDAAAVLRVLALNNFVRPWSITCMLRSAANLAMTNKLGVDRVLCTNDLTMRWVAKTVTDCPGIVCLIANLLSSSDEWGHANLGRAGSLGNTLDLEDEADDADDAAAVAASTARSRWQVAGERAVSAQALGGLGSRITRSGSSSASGDRGGHLLRGGPPDDDLGQYLLGASSQLLVDRLPMWAQGRDATWLYEKVSVVNGIQLLGVRDGDNMHIFPRNVVINVRTTLGIWVARSQRQLTGFVRTEFPPERTLEDLCADLSLRAGEDAGSGAADGSAVLPQPSQRAELEVAAAASGDGFDTSAPSFRLGAPESSRDGEGAGGAGAFAGASSDGGAGSNNRVVVCGWPADVDKLMAVLLDRRAADARGRSLRVTHIAQRARGALAAPRRSGQHALVGGRYTFVEDDPSDRRYTFVEGDPLDRETLKQHVLKPGLLSVIIFHEHLRDDGDGMGAVICAAKVESMLPRGHKVRIVTHLSSTADIRFVERSSWWPSDDDVVLGHLTSPTYAAGAVVADEMVLPLMMGWSKEGLIEFATRLTDTLVDNSSIALFELPPDLAARAQPVCHSHAVRKSGADATTGAGGAHSAAPAGAHGHSAAAGGTVRDGGTSGSGGRKKALPLTWGEVRAYFLLRHQRLCIGLYRERTDGIGKERVLRHLPFCYTNPPNATRVRTTDRIFALTVGDVAIRNIGDHSSRVVMRACSKVQSVWRDYKQRRWALGRGRTSKAPEPTSVPESESDISARLEARLAPLEEELRAVHRDLRALTGRLDSTLTVPAAKHVQHPQPSPEGADGDAIIPS